ncbi:unnamed protein product [Brassicogethes aeneus]|uniref:RRM domain-containing protein n=1 Tax=Brassicogethes aeneus TaxID=1431903 RepID=A0A9P0B697_BRAAE|nr:unnamed protein product [Brassicogethes aeneus]
MSSVDGNLCEKVESSTNENFNNESTNYSAGKRFPGRYNRNKKWNSRPVGNFKEDKGPNEKFREKLEQLRGNTFDLPPVDLEEKKFSGRNRLYIGNIGNEITEDDCKGLFSPYGEINELFLNKEKSFGFVRLDYYTNALKAKRELDGVLFKNRNLKIRFAPSTATIKVKNLSLQVSNELLHHGFRVFGEIERAVICVDERGKPTGEGIVEFIRKGSATYALNTCREGCYFLTASLRPCIVEPFDIITDNDGYPEKHMIKRNNEYNVEREVGPTFADPGTFKYEYGKKWKQLFDLFKEKEDALKKQFLMEVEKLEAQLEYAKYEQETEMLREQLRYRELDRERQKREWEMKEKHMEEQRRKIEENIRMQQEEIENSMRIQEENIRMRQQENKLFLQKHRYNQGFNNADVDVDNNSLPDYGSSSKPLLEEFDQNIQTAVCNDQYPGYWVKNDADKYQKKRRFM